MSLLSKPITAHELARRVLLHPRGGIKPLIELVGQSETEWLEFKAATHPKDGIFGKHENANDYYWHVAKAVIALANSIGGVVLLGVIDDGSVIGIDASDPEGRRQTKGAEAFRREIVMQKILLPCNGWKTGRQKNFQLVNDKLLERLVVLEEIPYDDGKSVLAIFVDQVPKSYGFVEVDVQTKQGVDRKIYVRKRGAVGQVGELAEDQADILSIHEAQCQKNSTGIELLWKKFEESGRLALSLDKLLPDIKEYIKKLKQRLANPRFIPLEAIQRFETKTNTGSRHRRDNNKDNWARGDGPCKSENRNLPITKPQPRKIDAIKLLEQSTRTLLIGEGGAGKSSCLEAFVLKSADTWQQKQSEQPWPLLVSLASFKGNGLAELISNECGIDWQDLLPLIKNGQLILCLDGLNECPDIYYDQCLANITGILREYPDARVLVTSRTSHFPPDPDMEKFEIEPMNQDLQNRFLEVYLAEPQQAKFILEQLHLHPEGRMLAESPMLLRIAAEVTRETDEIPNRRSALYRRFLYSWFQREDENHRRKGEVLPWNFTLVISALAELAYQARLKGIGRITFDWARKLLIHQLGEQTGHFIKWASQGTVLVHDTDSGDLQFEHETIQEYLCAEYLVARHEDMDPSMLVLRADAKHGIWAMPLAFAFEMLDQPSSSFVAAAWKVEPIIVATRADITGDYCAEDVDGDLWLKAVLNVLLGKDPSAQIRDITFIAHLPPKYPISAYLLSSLNSRSFWYSAQTHDTDTTRVEHLRDLICGTDFPWIELSEDALIGRKTLAEGLSPALRAITGSSPTPSLTEILSSASVSELCALRRRKLISADIFLKSWKTALDHSSKVRLDLDLLDILRTEKEYGTEILQDMLPLYQARLGKIAFKPKLSLRLLNILLRGKVVSVEDVRRQPGFVENICNRMSMMNAIRLTKSRLVRRSDINDETRARLVFDRSTNFAKIKEAIRLGLLEPEDIPAQMRGKVVVPPPRTVGRTPKRFSIDRLCDPRSRNKVNAELENQRWEVVLKRIPAEKDFGFVSHPDFEDDIFCPLFKIVTSGYNQLNEGQKFDVQITTNYDEKKKRWSFAVRSGRSI